MVLPEDVLAAVFGRLAPRSLAASRCVCKAWRDVIDASLLLRAELLPHSVRGVFLEYRELYYPVFLARPSTGPAIAGKLDFLLDPARSDFATVLDHCNGLLLYQDEHGLYVLNPATQWWAHLPPAPCKGIILEHIAHLVFDPSESTHYEVFLVSDNPDRGEEVKKCWQEMNTPSASMISGQTPLQPLSPSAAEDTEEPEVSILLDGFTEWPPSTSVLCVFSSRTGHWEERAFASEGKPAGTVADMRLQEYSMFWRGYAVYWRSALYAHCNGGDFIVRISLSDDKYRIIDMPSDIEWIEHSDNYLGKSAKGVSCAHFPDRYHLQVWLLEESCDQIEWVLKHHIDMVPVLRVLNYDEQQKTEGP